MLFLRQSHGYNYPNLELPTSESELSIVNRKRRAGLSWTASVRTITFEFAEAIAFNYFWMCHKGLSKIELDEDSSDSSALLSTSDESLATDSRYVFLEVSGASSVSELRLRATRASAATTGYIYEVQFLEQIFELNNTNERPMQFYRVPSDPGARFYRTRDSQLVSYSGLSERGKQTFYVRWDYMDEDFIDQMVALWEGPPIKRPFVLFPNSAKPSKIYELYWQNDPRIIPSAVSLSSGESIDMVLREV